MVKPVKSQYTIRWVNKISEIPQTAWDALALPLKTPFLEWEWLYNLEVSGSVSGKTGWLPYHLTLWRDQSLIAGAPLYLKGHSYGEFVFDHQWADLAQRLGISYYPKLLGMTPMTPTEGYQFLISPAENFEIITELMVNAIDHFCQENKLSSCHFLYADPQWKSLMERFNFTSWLHHSYIWKNQGYQSFDDYLAIFNANQRRNIKRERKAIEKAGLERKILTGDEIPHRLFTQMYEFYENTCDKFGWWGSKYLTKGFFEELYHRYRHRVLFVIAHEPSQDHLPMGMSFCIRKGENLYGRYWGSREEIECLHFDTCYYSPIEWSIQQNIKVFDPGAGGQHKKRRGFPATPNYSLHRFYHPRLETILQSYLTQVNELEQQEIYLINQDLPFSVNNGF